MSSKPDEAEKIGAKWSNVKRLPRTNWWQSGLIRRRISERLAGEACSGKVDEGALKVLKAKIQGRTFTRGISVGCGTGVKEMQLLQAGVVEHFQLFELSHQRIEQGRAAARELGLSDRIEFSSEDAFTVVKDASVDFVHWNNALHHMFDVHGAVTWSRRILKPGGLFFMNDFVGPNRRQWSDKALALGSRIRWLLPEKYVQDPRFAGTDEKRLLARTIRREDPAKIEAHDPSEAVQSQEILNAIARVFPGAEIMPAGGLVYHMVLTLMLANFDERDAVDRAFLELLLLVDELCVEVPGLENHYAIATAWKEEAP